MNAARPFCASILMQFCWKLCNRLAKVSRMRHIKTKPDDVLQTLTTLRCVYLILKSRLRNKSVTVLCRKFYCNLISQFYTDIKCSFNIITHFGLGANILTIKMWANKCFACSFLSFKELRISFNIASDEEKTHFKYFPWNRCSISNASLVYKLAKSNSLSIHKNF